MSPAPTLTRAGMAQQIQLQTGLPPQQARAMVEALLDLLGEALLEGEKVKIPNFGTFLVRDKAARRGRNPQTGEEILLSRRRVLVFRASPALRQILNGADDDMTEPAGR